jgi:hypothetical protein
VEEQSSETHFPSLGDFLSPALALLGQGLKKSPIGQKLDFANHPLASGLNRFAYQLLFMLMIALTVSVSVQIVGVLLITSLLKK